jgi:hypothetical protein
LKPDPWITDMPTDDAFYRSHFAHANHLADRSYEQVRPAYRLGEQAAAQRRDTRSFEEIEQDLEHGWLNVRVGAGEWASVREFVRAGFDRARQGRIPNAPPAGDADRAPFSDPLGAAIDPATPDHPERL